MGVWLFEVGLFDRAVLKASDFLAQYIKSLYNELRGGLTGEFS
jgi:hypothetical protein